VVGTIGTYTFLHAVALKYKKITVANIKLLWYPPIYQLV